MDSTYLSQGNLELSAVGKFRLLIQKRLQQYRDIHWTLKIPALPVILVYLLFLPTILLADKIKIVINLALILALVACAYVYGRSTGLQDGATIGIIEGVDMSHRWVRPYVEPGQVITGNRADLESYFVLQQTVISKEHPILQQQVLQTLDMKIDKWSEKRKEERRNSK